MNRRGEGGRDRRWRWRWQWLVGGWFGGDAKSSRELGRRWQARNKGGSERVFTSSLSFFLPMKPIPAPGPPQADGHLSPLASAAFVPPPLTAAPPIARIHLESRCSELQAGFLRHLFPLSTLQNPPKEPPVASSSFLVRGEEVTRRLRHAGF